MIETPQKGNHSIRKTCLSNMGESRALSDEEIRRFAGHKDFATTEKYYMLRKMGLEPRQIAVNTLIERLSAHLYQSAFKRMFKVSFCSSQL